MSNVQDEFLRLSYPWDINHWRYEKASWWHFKHRGGKWIFPHKVGFASLENEQTAQLHNALLARTTGELTCEHVMTPRDKPYSARYCEIHNFYFRTEHDAITFRLTYLD